MDAVVEHDFIYVIHVSVCCHYLYLMFQLFVIGYLVPRVLYCNTWMYNVMINN